MKHDRKALFRLLRKCPKTTAIKLAFLPEVYTRGVTDVHDFTHNALAIEERAHESILNKLKGGSFTAYYRLNSIRATEQGIMGNLELEQANQV